MDLLLKKLSYQPLTQVDKTYYSAYLSYMAIYRVLLQRCHVHHSCRLTLACIDSLCDEAFLSCANSYSSEYL